jgi:hypothetical protein
MTLLEEEISRWKALPFRWGKVDCMLVLADWVERVHGFDPAFELRGRYASPLEAERIGQYVSDPIAAPAAVCSVAGFEKTANPVRGDVGVVLNGTGPIGAICLGRNWAAKAVEGVMIGRPLKVLSAWSVGDAE